MTKGRFIFYCALLAAAVYGGLIAWPAAYFRSSCSYKNITLHTREPLASVPEAFLGRITDAAAGGEFYDPSRNFDVYLGAGRGGYLFWAPFCGKSHSCVHPFSGNIFIASADLEKNSAYGPGGEQDRRVLESVITHEIVKAQLRKKLGALKYAALSDWKKNGYAEHMARETADMRPEAICVKSPEGGPLPGYLEDRLIIESIQSAEFIKFAEIMEGNYGGDAARARLKQQYCGKP